VFDFAQPPVIAGFVLGLASSLHCLGMCSGIAASLCLAAQSLPGTKPRKLYVTNLVINAGRITGYMLAGAVVGALGARAFGALDRSIVYIVLRWAAAVALGWVGLSMSGLAPFPAVFYRVAAVASDGLATGARMLRLPSGVSIFAAGCLWGLFPCAMVYAALFYAMLTGAAFSGAAVMLGFGLGTLLPVAAAGMGLPLLRQRARSPRFRTIFGLAIMLLGVATALVPAATFAQLCQFG
jgi:uncharacterized protein